MKTEDLEKKKEMWSSGMGARREMYLTKEGFGRVEY